LLYFGWVGEIFILISILYTLVVPNKDARDFIIIILASIYVPIVILVIAVFAIYKFVVPSYLEKIAMDDPYTIEMLEKGPKGTYQNQNKFQEISSDLNQQTDSEDNEDDQNVKVGTKSIELAGTYYQQGLDIWLESKDYAKADDFYKKSLEIDPKYPPALASHGYIIGAFYNEFDKGKALIEEAMILDPTYVYAPFNLGILYNLNGNSKKGVEMIQYAIDLNPTHPDADYFREFLANTKDMYAEELKE